MSTPQDGMPPVYHGVWQRTLYAGAGDEGRHIEDRTTRVIWLQTAHWHADLRVPAGAPTGVRKAVFGSHVLFRAFLFRHSMWNQSGSNPCRERP